MLGSFPPARTRWSMEFFYPNFTNDMWRIFGLVFFGDKEYFVVQGAKKFDKERIVEFLTAQGIALGDTARSIIRLRNNASDAFLQIVEPIDLTATMTKILHCRAIITTGQKATDTLVELTGAPEPKVGGYVDFTFAGREMRFYRMPSSSRAYPKPLTEKAEAYRRMFEELGILGNFE